MKEMEGQMSIYDLGILCGRTSPEHYPQESPKERTSASSSKNSQKSQTKMPLFLNLRTGSGQAADASWETDGASLGEYSMHSFGESPNAAVESHLSQILEANPHPKYFLSDRACLGILTRASRRGKTLPPMLEEALIQTVVKETEYGQEGIADTVEILREMRCEIGEEALKEWVQRTFVLVQSEEVLLGEMCESCEGDENSNEQVLVEGDGEESIREEGLFGLRDSGEVGDTPQRREPNEQLSEQLDMLMQKLPHENAQKAVIVYCLRIACEGEEPVSEALSAISERETADHREGVLTFSKPKRAQTATDYESWQESDTANTLNAFDTGDVRTTEAVVQSFNWQGAAGAGLCVEDNIVNPVACTRTPAVCYWDGGQVAGTLTANNAGGSQRMPDKDNFNCVIQGINGDVAGTLDSSYYKGCGMRQGVEREVVAVVQKPRYIVRRLTPLECERLQGFPDGWTDIGEWIDSKGKKHQSSDASRFKALGNSIALPAWKWLLKRLCACYERDATMASLFSGIGGFDLLWTQINGMGSVLWESEIDDFPSAVCKRHFGGEDTGEKGDFYEAILGRNKTEDV